MQHTRPPQAKAAVAAPAVVQVGGVGALLPWAAALVGILPGIESTPACVLKGVASDRDEQCHGAGGRMLEGLLSKLVRQLGRKMLVPTIVVPMR